jgi:hypothetical protein
VVPNVHRRHGHLMAQRCVNIGVKTAHSLAHSTRHQGAASSKGKNIQKKCEC